EITDGLVPGDLVVTQGNRELYTLWLSGGSKFQSGSHEEPQ
ncbi:TPA: efflux RND transporter periplasmic adaptor subunit, partial [Legionella pneumophila]|nr:efflux RND transporter periplasmic adaptor subunit [Legionella pneumophila]